MSADAQLQDAYQEWRRLAEAEGEAIRASNWTVLHDCQSALQRLQPRIIRWTEEAQQEWQRLGADRSSKEQDLRTVISGLIEIEWRNNALLNVLYQAAKAESSELDQAGHNLRRVQRSYTQSPPAAWTSFS
jgi:hypothetical protein